MIFEPKKMDCLCLSNKSKPVISHMRSKSKL